MQGKFNQYDIKTELAKKHSHSTYLASPINAQRAHDESERQVVLTVFPTSLFHFSYERENLLEKAQRIKQLQHSHLMPILDIGVEEEQPFVVREYLANDSLRSRLKQISPRRLELREALAIVSQVGQALAYAHEHNVLHGNLKPENILFDATGQIFLTDFYLVSRKDAVIRDQTSGEYAFCYLAPEQFTGRCDARSDQYALGCLAYELITGSVPFAAQSLASMMGQPNSGLPIPLSESVAGLPPSLDVAVLKTLAKDPDERFFDFSLFLEVIQSVLSPPPAFPLMRSIYSRTNRAISHSVKSAKLQAISSPIRKRAKPQQPEPSGASSSTKSSVAEPADKGLQHNRSSAIMIEAMSQPALTSEVAMSMPIIEEIDDVLFNDPFREEEVDGSLGLALFGSSVHGQSQSRADWMLSPSTNNTDLPNARTVRTLRSRKKVLGLTLALSMSVALLAYAVWPSGMTQHDTSSHSTQALIHGLIPQIPNQVSNPPTDSVSARTDNSAAQGTNNNPTTQSLSQISSKAAASSSSSLNSSSPSSNTSSSPSTPSTSPPSSSSSPQPSTTTTNMTIYFSGWTDNSPPGASIAYPQIHQTAGGTGTYSDPITFAASQNALSPGTIIYVSYLKKYFIMEDDCGDCDSTWNNNHSYEISLWIGGDANSSQSAQQSCANSLTPSSAQAVEVKPPSNNAVDTTPLFTDSGGCIKV